MQLDAPFSSSLLLKTHFVLRRIDALIRDWRFRWFGGSSDASKNRAHGYSPQRIWEYYYGTIVLELATPRGVYRRRLVRVTESGGWHVGWAEVMKDWVEDFGLFLSRLGARPTRRGRSWPHTPGKYFVLDPDAPVAVSTLASVPLAEALRDCHPKGLCIVGRTVTENVGIEKVIRNVVSNQAIRYFVIAGEQAPVHCSGQTFQALHKNGLDSNKHVIGSQARKPVLTNIGMDEIAAFRDRIEFIDMMGCDTPGELVTTIERLCELAAPTPRHPIVTRSAPRIRANQDWDIQLDSSGYFVISVVGQEIVVEHYDYSNKLLRTLEGSDARSVYLTIVDGGWVSDLGHAAYLGKELARAEHSIRTNGEFVQDGA